MKRFISLLSVVSLLALGACTDGNDDMNNVYDSVITPDFTISDGEIVAGTTAVTFTNATVVEGTTVTDYFWHFGFSGEGNWSEEAQPDPVVYKQAGEYTVTLTAWGADGNRATVKKIVTVLADNVLPTADFSYAPMMVNVGDEVTFTDKSSDSDGEIVSRKWTFPDGSTSTDASPTYTFSAQGMFRVTLTVTDNRGGESSVTKSINVREGDDSEFTVLWSKEVASADALCAANVVTVSDLGYIYAVTGDGVLVALDAAGEVAWEYDAAAQDKVLLTKEIAYASVDADGTVYWAAHAYGDKNAAPTVYAFEGATGSVVWKNQTAYVSEDRIAYSTPCITPEMLVVGNRGTSGMLRRFDKASGRNTGLRLREPDRHLVEDAQVERCSRRRFQADRCLVERRRTDALHRGRCRDAVGGLRPQYVERSYPLVLDARRGEPQHPGRRQPRTGACRHRERNLCRPVAGG